MTDHFVNGDFAVKLKHVYDTIMQAVSNNAGGLYFLDAPGGTGKTFVISLILATIRSEQIVALALASSGIAATLFLIILWHKCTMANKKSKQLLEIGDGKIQINSTNGLIALPNNFCTIAQSIDELIECVFPYILQNYRNHDWLRERAILAPKNIHINAINFQIQAKLPGVVTTYKSIDSVMNQDEAMNYPIEFLSSLEPAGMPPHCLNLKVCNGTRLAVKKLLPNLIEATILTAKSKGEVCLIPRIPMIPTDMPFEFKRLQYPVR